MKRRQFLKATIFSPLVLLFPKIFLVKENLTKDPLDLKTNYSWNCKVVPYSREEWLKKGWEEVY